MKAASFRYHRPRTADEAVALLASVADADGRVIAGGQSLVPMMAFRLARPSDLVDINAVAEFARLEVSDGWLSIGACVRHAAFHVPVAPSPLAALLCQVADNIAHYPIRTRGTFCGSLAHADPASEWCLVAATLGAQIRVRSQRGTRTIAAADFFRGVMTTALASDELITEVRLPVLPADTRFGFYEFSRRAGDYALAAALVTYRVHHGRIADARVGVGGAEARPRRLPEAETILDASSCEPEVFRRAAEAASAAIAPMVDAQATGAFRRTLVRTAVARALSQTVATHG